MQDLASARGYAEGMLSVDFFTGKCFPLQPVCKGEAKVTGRP